MSNWKTDCGLSAVLLALSAAVLVYSNSFEATAAKFPRLVAIGTIICAVLLLLFALKEKAPGSGMPWRQYGNVAVLAGVLILYAILMPLIGYILSSLMVFAAVSVFLGARKISTITIVDLCTTGAVYVIFRFLLKVPLPAGPFGS